ncbi:MAG: hypothetical protein RJA52_1507 [Bacteroidota bacterium]
MNWTEHQIFNVMQELAEENTLACFAMLSIAKIEFSDKIETLAISIGSTPILFINKKFLNSNIKCDHDLKTVLFHEYLHIILGHHLIYNINNPILNIALDAIINQLICKLFGQKSAEFFRRFYPAKGINILLRPMEDSDSGHINDLGYRAINRAIYSGKLTADECYEYLTTELPILCGSKSFNSGKVILIGDHSWGYPVDNSLLRETIEKNLNHQELKNLFLGGKLENDFFQVKSYALKRWEGETYRLIKKCLKEGNSIKKYSKSRGVFPVWNGRDRRAFFQIIKSTPLFSFDNPISRKNIQESVRIYLDVSGSMENEIHPLVTLLKKFYNYVEKPLWVFSTDVQSATFKSGKLVMNRSNGTNINAVYSHIIHSKSSKNIIITDGYIDFDTFPPPNTQFIISAKGYDFGKKNPKYQTYQLSPISNV